MKYDILTDFPGSQDGSVTEQFVAGTQRELSDYLAAIVVPCGWAKPVETSRFTEPSAPADDEGTVSNTTETARPTLSRSRRK